MTNLNDKYLLIQLISYMAHTCDIKSKQIYRYLLLKETVKLDQLPTSLSVNFEVCQEGFQK